MSQAVPTLTTTFVPPSSCLTDTYLYVATLNQPYPYFYSLGPPDTSDCFPSGWKPATTAYFSPEVCPLDYNIACSNYNSIGTLTETIATCCPSCSSAGPPWFTGEACTSEILSNAIITVLILIIVAVCNWFVRRRRSVHIPSQEVAPVYSDEGYSSAEDIMIIFYDYLSDRVRCTRLRAMWASRHLSEITCAGRTLKQEGNKEDPRGHPVDFRIPRGMA